MHYESLSAFNMVIDVVSQFQKAIVPRLSAVLGGAEVRAEWRTMADRKGVYSPRLDLAVGPFAVAHEVYSEEFNTQIEKHREFVQMLHACSSENFERITPELRPLDYGDMAFRNANARCFMAIEIENQVSRKHLMGGAINAAALGRIGIAIGWTEGMVRAFVKLRAYLLYLASVGKNTFDPFNLLVLSKDQFGACIEQAEKSGKPRAGRRN
jgi:hypothetical protein